MKTLILLRHAKSDWLWNANSVGYHSDIYRPLSQRGHTACKKISSFLSSRKVKVDLVEYSPAKRTTETFNLIKKSFSYLAQKQNPELYTFNSRNLINVISNTPTHVNNLLIIGHNPAIEGLVNDLVSPNRPSKYLSILRKKYPTGALAYLELDICSWSQVHQNCASLVNFVRPSDIES